MPTYEYACRSCGEHLEVVQSFKDDSLTVCPNCQGELRKVFSAAGIIFKGSGWHIKDYATSSSGGGSSSGSSGSGGDAGSGSANGGSSSKDSSGKGKDGKGTSKPTKNGGESKGGESSKPKTSSDSKGDAKKTA